MSLSREQILEIVNETTLVVAQELETSHKRYEFAEAFALGNASKPYRPRPYQQNYQPTENKNQNINKPIPLEIDNGSSFYRQRNKFQTSVSPQQPHAPQQLSKYTSKPQNPQSSQLAESFKRSNDRVLSDRSPFHKIQKVNFMTEVEIPSNDREYESFSEDYNQYIGDLYNYNEVDVTPLDNGDEDNYLN
ncbi:unnamed protein product [Ceratitis capitata]|uniref:(Mediterranean fruit fly) hypothetical protein n=1 Tax=Ceratitis capitata TaxID=7213 RepID=A0A811UUD9_CERCA|nr:unnamed protein product [Ceratitis capitata]